jgi:hypothetical protein
VGKVIQASHALGIFPNKVAQYIVDNPISVASELAIIPSSWIVLRWWLNKRRSVIIDRQFHGRIITLSGDLQINSDEQHIREAILRVTQLKLKLTND